MAELAQVSRENRAWACYDCGKCTATCPIARFGGAYSPRRHVLATNLGSPKSPSDAGSLSSCLTCSLCDVRCPANVRYTDLVRNLRALSHAQRPEPECPHGGALQSVMRMMAQGGTQQDRLGWLTDDLKTNQETGDVFYWTGCAMYYDAFFTELELATLDAVRAAVRLLNRLDITPVVSPQERCCGHDLLWNGDQESFERLARHNVGLVAESGASILVTSCAECLRTWKIDYAPYFPKKAPRVFHITEFLLQHHDRLSFRHNGGRRVTYQDPCRLGRHLEIYDPPRELLAAIPGIEVKEMRRTRGAAVCCAGGTWSNCDRFAKRIQVDRLQEARATEAAILVTACPKCQIHLRCAMKDPNLRAQIEMEMRDVAELVDEAVEVKRPVAGTAAVGRS